MSIRSSVALALVLAVTASSTPALVTVAAQQTQGNGIISGKADAEAKKPYTDYKVQVRDLATSQIVATVALDPQAKFAFNNLGLAKRYLVEIGRASCRERV